MSRSGKAEKAAKKEAVKVAQTPAAKKGKTEAVVTPAVPASGITIVLATAVVKRL